MGVRWHIASLYIAFFCIMWRSSSVYASDCEHDEYKTRRETIVSQNYPENYPNNFCKRWFISANDNEIITISIRNFHVELGDDLSCNRDFVQLGPNPIRTLCGMSLSKEERVYISDGKHMSIYFKTDHMTTYKGFELQYIAGPVPALKCEDDEFHCGNGKCIYSDWKCNGLDECGDGSDESEIECPTGDYIPPVPGDMNCGEAAIPCYSNYSKAYICLPNTQICDGHTDCLSGEDEIDCPDSSVVRCNAHLHELTGYIVSPNYPKDYPVNKDCKWTIHMQVITDVIQLRFLDFNLQTNENTDYLKVYDGKDDTSDKLLGTFYGRNFPPEKLESTSNWMILKFHSDSTFSEKGFNISYQRKGTCLLDQRPCSLDGENDCYEVKKRCDGIWDCPVHGGDEVKCGNCRDMYTCGPHSSQCYSKESRCSGVGQCTNLMDEKHCSPTQCGSHNGTFLCQNKHCIYETWQCDKTDDCGDNSDEKNCSRSSNLIIIAAVAGSLICGLLLVVALGCTCKLYTLRMQQLHGHRYETPLSRLYAEFMRQRAPPPYHEAMLTSRPYEEARREYMARLSQSEQSNTGRSGRRNLRRSGRRHRHQTHSNTNTDTPTDNTSSSSPNSPHSANSRQEDIGNSNEVNSVNSNSMLQRQSSTTALIPNDTDSDESVESEIDGSRGGECRVQYMQETGVTAQFRRNGGNKNDTEECSNLLQRPQVTESPIGDISSLDTTTIASCDSVDLVQDDNKEKTDNIQTSDTPPQNNQSISVNRERGLNQSNGSLDSAGSETMWGEFTNSEVM